MSTSFETALRQQIEETPVRKRRAKKLLAVLDMEDGPRRQRILARLERHAAAHLELDGQVGAIDWANIDWAKLFEQIFKLLMMILPMFL